MDLSKLWQMMKENDLPNWIVVLFTAIFWPLILFLWNRRTFRNIANLQISIFQYKLTMYGADYNAVRINFVNQTGSVVYVSNPRLKPTKYFMINSQAAKDIVESYYILNFLGENNNFNKREIILQTGATAITAIALDGDFDIKMLTYKPSWWRKFFRIPYYFKLEYIATVGSKNYKVSSNY